MIYNRKINIAFFSFTLLFISLAALSCKKESVADATIPSANSINAQAECDYNTAGVYKGILCGLHSGNFVLFMANGNHKVQAIVNYNNLSDTLSTQDLLGWQPGGLVSATFTNIAGSGIRLDVQILKSNGDSINVTAKNLSDTADVIFAVASKEFSTMPVQCYEGSYRYDDSTNETYKRDGKWSFVIRGTVLTGLMYSNSSYSVRRLRGNNGKGDWQSDTLSRNFTFGPASSYMTGNFSEQGVEVGTYQTEKTL